MSYLPVNLIIETNKTPFDLLEAELNTGMVISSDSTMEQLIDIISDLNRPDKVNEYLDKLIDTKFDKILNEDSQEIIKYLEYLVISLMRTFKEMGLYQDNRLAYVFNKSKQNALFLMRKDKFLENIRHGELSSDDHIRF